jgi:hypothetical protein
MGLRDTFARLIGHSPQFHTAEERRKFAESMLGAALVQYQDTQSVEQIMADDAWLSRSVLPKLDRDLEEAKALHHLRRLVQDLQYTGTDTVGARYVDLTAYKSSEEFLRNRGLL